MLPLRRVRCGLRRSACACNWRDMVLPLLPHLAAVVIEQVHRASLRGRRPGRGPAGQVRSTRQPAAPYQPYRTSSSTPGQTDAAVFTAQITNAATAAAPRHCAPLPAHVRSPRSFRCSLSPTSGSWSRSPPSNARGMVGLPVYLGATSGPHAAFWQLAGRAARLPAAQFRSALRRDGVRASGHAPVPQATMVQFAQERGVQPQPHHHHRAVRC